MSQENVEVVRQQFRALELGGVDAAAAFWHPEIEWRAVVGAADDVGVMKGRDALRRYYSDWTDTFDELRAVVDEVIFAQQDELVASVRHTGRGRASGVPTDGRYYVACIVRDGQIVTGREYGTRHQALAAVGRAE